MPPPKKCLTRKKCLTLFWVAVWVLGGTVTHAQEPKEKVTTQKTREGLHFELPPDWPVEKHGGLVAPIPVEEYLAMKFNTLEARLQTIEQQLGGFDIRLRAVEEELKNKQKGLRSSEPPAP